MNILVTGSNGQLGNEIRKSAPLHATHQYFFTDVQELDITDTAAVFSFVKTNHIDFIINCAAYTNVDKAEADEATAQRINAYAVQNLARTKLPIIHVSTDYVFDGSACIPYTEDMPAAPLTAYGRTKSEGERLLLQSNPKAIILRTAWLYSSYGNNFVKTMLNLFANRKRISVVFDQAGTPTYAADLAQAIFHITESEERVPGIYHFTNEGVCSWYDFATEIKRQTKAACEVLPILSSEYPSKTPRPHYSVLDKSKIKKTFHYQIPHWTDGLARCLRELGKQTSY